MKSCIEKTIHLSKPELCRMIKDELNQQYDKGFQDGVNKAYDVFFSLKFKTSLG